MTNETLAPTVSPPPVAAIARRAAPSFVSSSLRIFDLSLGEMLWSRRTIFMGLLVAAPVLISALVVVALVAGARAAALWMRSRSASVPNVAPRPALVLEGPSRAAIARRTGLSRDAVALAMHLRG